MKIALRKLFLILPLSLYAQKLFVFLIYDFVKLNLFELGTPVHLGDRVKTCMKRENEVNLRL